MQNACSRPTSTAGRASATGAAAADAFLARFGQRRRGLLFEKRLHFTESIIEVGERIAVVGLPVQGPEPAPDRESPYRQRHAGSSPPHVALSLRPPLVITDDPAFAPPLPDD